MSIVLSVYVYAATSGGAGYCAGDVAPLSGSLIIAQSTFVANDAQLGGSLYATTGCIAVIQGSRFLRNTARQYGSAVVTTDYVTMTVSGTSFEGNGDSAGISPPSAGGAISIGYNQFVVGAAQPDHSFAKIHIEYILDLVFKQCSVRRASQFNFLRI